MVKIFFPEQSFEFVEVNWVKMENLGMIYKNIYFAIIEMQLQGCIFQILVGWA